MPDNQCWGLHLKIEVPELTYEILQVDGTKRLASPPTLQYYPVTVVVLERSRGSNQITSVRYWHNQNPADTSVPFSTIAIPAGYWDSLGLELTSNGNPEQIVNGAYRYFFARVFIGGSSEATRILRSPDAWPELNAATAWSPITVAEGFRFIFPLNFISNFADSNFTNAISGTKSYSSTDLGLTWSAGATVSATRAVNDRGNIAFLDGNTIHVSYDSGATIDHSILLDAGDHWTDVAYDDDRCIVCGTGTNKVAMSSDVLTTFNPMTVPGGWDPADPRIAFQYATPGSPGAGRPWVITDATPGATAFLRNSDPTIPNAWTLVTVPAAPSGERYTALAWSWEPNPAGPGFAFFIAPSGNTGYIRSLDGGATWAARAWGVSPLS